MMTRVIPIYPMSNVPPTQTISGMLVCSLTPVPPIQRPYWKRNLMQLVSRPIGGLNHDNSPDVPEGLCLLSADEQSLHGRSCSRIQTGRMHGRSHRQICRAPATCRPYAATFWYKHLCQLSFCAPAAKSSISDSRRLIARSISRLPFQYPRVDRLSLCHHHQRQRTSESSSGSESSLESEDKHVPRGAARLIPGHTQDHNA